MTDSRWLQELAKTYVAESVGKASNLNEQLIQEQQQYITVLESVLADIVEQYNIDLDAILEEKAGYKFKGRAGGVEGEHDVEEKGNTVKIGGKTYVKKGTKGSGPRAVKRDGKWEPEGN